MQAWEERRKGEGKMTNKTEFFPLPLKGRYIGRGRWKLTAPFEYHSKKYGIFKVPGFFISDGASIPKFAFSFIGGRWTGKYVEAAIIHDYLYFTQTTKRNYADRIFLEAMKDLKVSWWKRRMMWTAVRVGGWRPWNRHKKNIISSD